ncbi:MAG: bifunctional ornithine acetyltransferase/N-acetylglutamate synthase, partial [Spartobacteria bacterium]
MIEIKKIKGGVCAARGFVAGVAGCGIKTGKVTRDDVAVVFSESPATSAATFTTNNVKAAPVRVSAEHLKVGGNRAVILNSGNANACTAEVAGDSEKTTATSSR